LIPCPRMMGFPSPSCITSRRDMNRVVLNHA
jgi:hypothetical protein